MGLSEFLARLPEDDSAPISYAALAELSGISSAEAAELARNWEEWPAERVRELFRRLASLAEEQAALEFEVVFKAGLDLADAATRAIAVAALAESTDRTLAASFAGLLERDPNATVRAAAASSMATLCTLAAEGRLRGKDGERMRLALLRALEDAAQPAAVRMRALETAAIFGGERVHALIGEAFRSGDSRLQQSALFAMGRTADPRWLEDVVSALDAPGPALRYEAVSALGEIGGEEHVHLLKGPLDDEDLEVQAAAVSALERIGGPGAVRLLKQALESPEPSIREVAQEALEMIEAEEGLSEVVGPEMRRRGDMFGGRAGAEVFGGDEEGEEYDAAEREGWGQVIEGKRARGRNGAVSPDDQDMDGG
jgi:HEAT repeat protein